MHSFLSSFFILYTLGRLYRAPSVKSAESAERELLEPFFEVLEFVDGLACSSKTGGPDLSIVKKPGKSC